MPQEDWDRKLTQRVAGEVKRLRGSERSVQWLSDRTAELGHRLGRSRLSDLERGDRGGVIGVAEVLVLAAALGVPPITLLFPGIPTDVVELLPDQPVESWDALRWFTGESRQAGKVSSAAQSTTLIDVLRELEDAGRRYRQSRSLYENQAALVAELLASGDEAAAAQAGVFMQAQGSNIAATAKRYNDILERLRGQGAALSDAERWQDLPALADETDQES